MHTRGLIAFFWVFAGPLCLASLPARAQPLSAPGLNELVILDPGQHADQLPAVLLEEFSLSKDAWASGGLQAGDVEPERRLSVEIPPQVHVHRYYYSGDKEFQGPILQGGPTILVAKHPRTGETMYVELNLRPGAPRIAHHKTGITYVYPDQRVTIHFQHFPFDASKAVVKYHSGQGVRRTLGQARQQMVARTQTHYLQSPVTQSLKNSAEGAGSLLHGVGQTAARTGGALLDRTDQLVNVLPGVQPLRSMGEQRAETRRAAEIRAANRLQQRAETVFVPTNR